MNKIYYLETWYEEDDTFIWFFTDTEEKAIKLATELFNKYKEASKKINRIRIIEKYYKKTRDVYKDKESKRKWIKSKLCKMLTTIYTRNEHYDSLDWDIENFERLLKLIKCRDINKLLQY